MEAPPRSPLLVVVETGLDRYDSHLMEEWRPPKQNLWESRLLSHLQVSMGESSPIYTSERRLLGAPDHHSRCLVGNPQFPELGVGTDQ